MTPGNHFILIGGRIINTTQVKGAALVTPDQGEPAVQVHFIGTGTLILEPDVTLVALTAALNGDPF